MPTVTDFLRAKLDETTDSLNELVEQRDKLGPNHTIKERDKLNDQINLLRRRLKELAELLHHHQ